MRTGEVDLPKGHPVPRGKLWNQVKRYPNGVEGQFFFEKNASRGKPDWVRTARLPVPGSTKNRDTIDFPVVEDLPSLVYYANLAALELHVPQWRVGPRGAVKDPDLLVIDLDPGAPAALPECAEVAQVVRQRLAQEGPKKEQKKNKKKRRKTTRKGK